MIFRDVEFGYSSPLSRPRFQLRPRFVFRPQGGGAIIRSFDLYKKPTKICNDMCLFSKH